MKQEKLDLKGGTTKPYIILNYEYSKSRPMYIRSVAMSSSTFDKHHIHTSEDLHAFYKNDHNCEVVFLEDVEKHPHFIELIKKLKNDKEHFENEYFRAVESLNRLNSALYDKSI